MAVMEQARLMRVLIKIGEYARVNRFLVVYCSLFNPKTQDIDFFVVEWFASVWHPHRRISPSLHQHIEYAVLTVPGHDHGLVDGAVHKIFIARHGQSGFQIPFTVRRGMTFAAVRSKDGLNVAPETDLPLLPYTAAG
jgi:hypothetical protein